MMSNSSTRAGARQLVECSHCEGSGMAFAPILHNRPPPPPKPDPVEMLKALADLYQRANDHPLTQAFAEMGRRMEAHPLTQALAEMGRRMEQNRYRLPK